MPGPRQPWSSRRCMTVCASSGPWPTRVRPAMPCAGCACGLPSGPAPTSCAGWAASWAPPGCSPPPCTTRRRARCRTCRSRRVSMTPPPARWSGQGLRRPAASIRARFSAWECATGSRPWHRCRCGGCSRRAPWPLVPRPAESRRRPAPPRGRRRWRWCPLPPMSRRTPWRPPWPPPRPPARPSTRAPPASRRPSASRRRCTPSRAAPGASSRPRPAPRSARPVASTCWSPARWSAGRSAVPPSSPDRSWRWRCDSSTLPAAGSSGWGRGRQPVGTARACSVSAGSTRAAPCSNGCCHG